MTSNMAHEYGSIDEAMIGLREHEIATESQYVVAKRSKLFGKIYMPTLADLKKSRIRYSGSSYIIGPIKPHKPFIVVGSLHLSCIHGKPRSQEKRKQTVDHQYKRERKMIQPSKKLGCPSLIKMQEVLTFDDYQAATKKTRDTTSQKLKSSDTIPKSTRLFIMCHANEHSDHVTGTVAGLNRKTSSGIVGKIHALVSSGTIRVPEVKSQLEKHVNRLPLAKKPTFFDRQYYPSNKTIYNHIQAALSNNRYSDEEQVNVHLHLKTLALEFPGLKYSFTPHSESNGQKFLVVIQSEWQRRLVSKFGEAILVDSTFNTTKYQLPLFEVVIHTNVGYSPVALIITEDETQTMIEQGFNILLSWNMEWHPTMIMTDYDTAQILALQNVFPGSSVQLCQFHREQAWKRWLSRSDNCLKCEQDEILTQCIAKSPTHEQFEENLKRLKTSDLWKRHTHLQNYLTNTWLNIPERWVRSFRPLDENITITTTNGVEVHHRLLKTLLKDYNARTAQSLIDIIVTKYLPDCLKSYTERNVKPLPSSKTYSDNIPVFLHGRPKVFVEHCLSRMTDACSYHSTDVTKMSCTEYSISSQSDPTLKYHVQLDIPKCECTDFLRHYMPCKHLLAVCVLYDSWQYIRSTYTDSKYYTLNDEFLHWINELPVQCSSKTTLPPSEQLCDIPTSLCDEIASDELASLHSQPLLIPSERQKANIILNNIRNYINNTSSLATINQATDLLQKCLDHLVRENGDVTMFAQSTPRVLKRGPLVVPDSFIKRRRITKRLQKRINYGNGSCQKHLPINVKRPKAILKKMMQRDAVQLKSDDAVQLNSDDAVQLNSDDAVQLKCDDAVQLNSDDAVQLNSDDAVQLKSDNAVQLKSEDAVQLKCEEAVQLNSDDAVQLNSDDAVQLKSDDAVQLNSDDALQLNSYDAVQLKGDDVVQLNSDDAAQLKSDAVQLKSDAVQLKSDNAVQLNSDDAVQLNSDDAVQLKCEDAVQLNSDDAVQLNSDDAVQLKSDDAVQLKSDDAVQLKSDDAVQLNSDDALQLNSYDAVQLKGDDVVQLNSDDAAQLKSDDAVQLKSDDAVKVFTKVPESCVSDGKLENPIIADVQEIWSYHTTSSSLMAVIRPYKLYGYSFATLRPRQRVGDEISFENYSMVLCPYNYCGHWALVVLFPAKRQLLYLDPLGETKDNAQSLLASWKTFVNRRFATGLERYGPAKWTLASTPPHSKQPDSVSCGIFVMKFAELLLQGEKLTFPASLNNINNIRKELSVILLCNCGNVTNYCRKCSLGYQLNEEWIQCNSCNWWHHFHCTDVARTFSNAGHTSFTFLCSTCQGLDNTEELVDLSICPVSPIKKRRLSIFSDGLDNTISTSTWEDLDLPTISPIKRQHVMTCDSPSVHVTRTPLHSTPNTKKHIPSRTCIFTNITESSTSTATITAHSSTDKTEQPVTSEPQSVIEPFVICHLNNQIKICAGCRGNFQKPIKEPDDFVIRHRELDSFFDKRQNLMRMVFQNKYYHISANCIKAKHPTFMKTSICIPPAIKLSNTHLIYFKSFGVDLSMFVNRKL